MTLVVHLIPHTHWDREWYLTAAQFGARLAPALDAVVDLLERQPSLRFHLDGQAVLVEDYLARRPDARVRLDRLVQAGRLVVGPWYVLADGLIPSGEAAIRNLLLGRDVAAQHGGAGKVLYSPDAFGQPGTGPLLAAEAGLVAGVVWRGLDPARIGRRDLFWWQSGERRLLTLHLPAPGYEFGADLVAEPERLEQTWTTIRTGLVERAVSHHVAVPIGADHHAPSDRLADLAERLASIDRGSEFRYSTFEEYFVAASASIDGAAPTFEGELRRSGGHAWALQGTFATRSRLKRQYGAAELTLARIAEPAVAIAKLDPGTLRDAWRRLVRAQFHDTLAGTCSDPVAREQAVRVAAVRAAAASEFDRGVARLIGHDPDAVRERTDQSQPRLVVWNPVARARGGVTVVESTWFVADELVGPPGGRIARTGPGAKACAIRAGSGAAPLALQTLAVRRGRERVDASRHYPDLDAVDRAHLAVALDPVPGLSATIYRITEPDESPAEPADPVVVRGRSVSNGRIGFEVDRRGRLGLHDRHREVRYHNLGALEWTADRGDCYTPEPGPARGSLWVGPIAAIAAGPLVGALAWEWRLSDGPESIVGRTTLSLTSDSDIGRVRIVLENQASQHRLRWSAPIGVRGEVLVGAPHGVERRPPGRLDSSWPGEVGLPTGPGHRFAAVAEGGRGLALLLPGFFEYQWTETGTLAVTLLRAVGDLSRNDLSTRRGHAGWVTPTPEAQEPGRHVIELALKPVDPSVLGTPAALIEAWEDAFLPPIPLWYRQSLPLVGGGGFELAGPGLVLEAVVPARERQALVIRVLNVSAQPVEGTWRCPWPVAEAVRVRGDGTPLGPVLVQGRSVGFRAQPGELVSVEIVPLT
ncbi:MAG: hypothetical protein FJ206_05525 [Gemmatimonadetes bacterium]|nr:hypothetical protein [Gemmatimonadota bacterium]